MMPAIAAPSLDQWQALNDSADVCAIARAGVPIALVVDDDEYQRHRDGQRWRIIDHPYPRWPGRRGACSLMWATLASRRRPARYAASTWNTSYMSCWMAWGAPPSRSEMKHSAA
jgi:hypothetical protein